ncbi:MAG: PaaI family thioesterase [Alphaproteobacteria bacterium]|nr:PaaI family thioesterase [Alphaproteobacteria bacterium]
MNDSRHPHDDPLEVLVGFNAELGFRLVEWEEGRAVMALDIQAKHRNRSGVLHGGVMATLIDAVCGHAGVWRPVGEPPAKALTLTLTTNFMGQAREGTVTAVATRKGGGKRIFFAAGEVLAADGTVLAMGEGSYRIRQSDPYSAG